MRLFVYEHLSGGGCAGKPLVASSTCEGYAILRAFTGDLTVAGHRVMATLDSRLRSLPLEADEKLIITRHDEFEAVFRNAARTADAALAIAPETGGALWKTVRRIEEESCPTLNSPASTLEELSGKSRIYHRLEEAGVPVPQTLTAQSLAEALEAVEKLGYPALLKPDDGVSCSGLSVVESANHVKAAVENVRQGSSAHRFIVQSLVKGVHVSLCMLCVRREAKPLTLNLQHVLLAAPPTRSVYLGGLVPFDHPLRGEAYRVGEAVVKALGPLRGYVGVDLVLSEGRALVVDVNLRLTTSYIGLSRVAESNIAELIVNAALEGRLPQSFTTRGFYLFRKVEVPRTLAKGFADEVSTTSIQLPSDLSLSMLIAAQGATPRQARARFSRKMRKLFKSDARLK